MKLMIVKPMRLKVMKREDKGMLNYGDTIAKESAKRQKETV